ncbi:MAG: prepilin-type N-terminal cleavage/methylation domain-containing protein [Armatimonadetes bacterium]|nr:prepilin-type N-terminal cleavage/methylation domain-containing protein [Armatimonadota bacterium]
MTIKTKGFTLIELLVVIAIIAILAAILFPVFAQAKAAAKKAADLSNQKQLATAMHMYAGDYDDRTPSTHHDLESGETAADLYLWYQPLQAYIKNRDVLKDPTVSANPSVITPGLTVTDWNNVRTDYLINGFFAHGAVLNNFSSPAQQILLAERNVKIGYFDYHPWASAPDNQWERGFLDGSGYALIDQGSDTQGPDPSNVGRHTNGNNYSFTDGHAKWYRFAQTLDKTKLPDAVDNFGFHNIDSLPSNEE